MEALLAKLIAGDVSAASGASVRFVKRWFMEAQAFEMGVDRFSVFRSIIPLRRWLEVNG